MTALDTIGLFWVDLETTGLDPEWDTILEAGWLLTDYRGNPLLVDQDYFGNPLPLSGAAYGNLNDSRALQVLRDPRTEGDKLVQQMHTDNGLWDALAGHRDSGSSYFYDQALEGAFEQALRYKAKRGWTELRLAGSNPAFDRAFLAKAGFDMDELGVSHRLHDMSSLRPFAELIGFREERAARPHRALGDVMQDASSWRDMVQYAEQVWEER